MLHPLKIIREAAKLERKEFARTIGIGPDFCYQVEEGYEELGKKTVLKVADRYRDLMDKLDIDVEDLLRGKLLDII